MKRLIAALVDGDRTLAVTETHRLLAAGVSKESIVTDALQAAMQSVDDKCTVEAFNLLEIMLVGRAVSGVAAELYPEGPPRDGARASLVIATPEGDVHDLGRKIVGMVLIGRGYRVVDAGRNCAVKAMAEAARDEQAEAVLVSGLLTTVIPQVRLLRPALDELGLLAVKILAGGAALKQASALDLNVDYVAESAFDGARFLDDLVAVKTS
jgi:dimethylamine corrinoid protein